MHTKRFGLVILSLILCLFPLKSVFSQSLQDKLATLFSSVLDNLQTVLGTEHNEHFIPANVDASARRFDRMF